MRVLLPEPGAGSVVGVNTAVTPLGNPVIEKATAALKPPLTVAFRFTLLFDPGTTEIELAEAAA